MPVLADEAEGGYFLVELGIGAAVGIETMFDALDDVTEEKQEGEADEDGAEEE